jgi:hypothetical protein
LREEGLIAAGPRSPRLGAPYAYVTTGFESPRDLPDLETLKDAGLLSSDAPIGGGDGDDAESDADGGALAHKPPAFVSGIAREAGTSGVEIEGPRCPRRCGRKRAIALRRTQTGGLFDRPRVNRTEALGEVLRRAMRGPGESYSDGLQGMRTGYRRRRPYP